MRSLFLEQISRTCLDELDADALVLSIDEVLNPPAGLAGWLDWRLNGFISETLLSNKFSGKPGEVVLIDTTGRIAIERVFIFGWSQKFFQNEGVLVNTVKKQISTVVQAGCEEIAIEIPIPGRSLELAASWEKAVLASLSNLDMVSDLHLFVEPNFFNPLLGALEAAGLPVTPGNLT